MKWLGLGNMGNQIPHSTRQTHSIGESKVSYDCVALESEDSWQYALCRYSLEHSLIFMLSHSIDLIGNSVDNP